MLARAAMLGMVSLAVGCSLVDLCYLNQSTCGGDAAATGDGGDWCATQPSGYRLCTDFDLPTQPITRGFDLGLIPVGSGGSFDLDPDIFVSPPYGALARANAYPAGGSTGAYLEATFWSFGPTPPSVRCSLQWNPKALSTLSNDYAHIIQLTVNATADRSGDQNTLSVNMLGDGSLSLLEFYPSAPGSSVAHVIPISVAIGTWLTVEISVTPTTYDVRVGGVAAPGKNLALPLAATSIGTVQIGPAYFGGATTQSSPGWLFDYDNVVCF